jgi:hypothetical protein
MFSKPSLSLTAAVALSAAIGGARADSKPTSTDEARAKAGFRRTNDEFNLLEMGNPNGLDYRNRMPPRVSTNYEIDDSETGNPNDDFRNRVAPRRWATSDEIDAAESGSPLRLGNR